MVYKMHQVVSTPIVCLHIKQYFCVMHTKFGGLNNKVCLHTKMLAQNNFSDIHMTKDKWDQYLVYK